jgi:hypothetical protein
MGGFPLPGQYKGFPRKPHQAPGDVPAMKSCGIARVSPRRGAATGPTGTSAWPSGPARPRSRSRSWCPLLPRPMGRPATPIVAVAPDFRSCAAGEASSSPYRRAPTGFDRPSVTSPTSAARRSSDAVSKCASMAPLPHKIKHPLGFRLRAVCGRSGSRDSFARYVADWVSQIRRL